MTELLCPVCAGVLSPNGKSLVCPNGHLFDIARSGYVNLVMHGGTAHGDAKEMLRARERFLSKGYYKPLYEALAGFASEKLPEHPSVLDAGCGEGYYTAGIKKAVREKGGSISAIDISRDAVDMTAKKLAGDGVFAVASVYSLPFPDKCFDAVYSVFSPLAGDEFARVLKDGGFLVRAYPLSRHLFELKEAVYDEPYLNPEPDNFIPGFTKISETKLRYRMEIGCGADIKDLFLMTPYSHKTSRQDAAKLDGLDSLSCGAQFGVEIHVKKRTCKSAGFVI